MASYHVSRDEQRNTNVIARQQKQRRTHILVSLLALAIFVVSTPPGVQSADRAIRVCKGGEAITFGAHFAVTNNRMHSSSLYIHYKRGTGKTDPLGRNLSPGECGFLGRKLTSRHQSKILGPRNGSWKYEVENGKITVSRPGKPWTDLKTKNKLIQFPVQIEQDSNSLRIVSLVR